MSTLTHGSEPAKGPRSLTRMDCPGVAPAAITVTDAGIGGRGTGWEQWHPDGEDELEPTIVRGRE